MRLKRRPDVEMKWLREEDRSNCKKEQSREGKVVRSGLWLIVTSVENVSFSKKFEDADELES